MKKFLNQKGVSSFSPDLKHFLTTTPWTFAKTYASAWPHWYLVRDKVDAALFLKLVCHIREHGYAGSFYKKHITYSDEDNFACRTMVPPRDDPAWYPPEEETIVNRCRKEHSWEYRKLRGELPD